MSRLRLLAVLAALLMGLAAVSVLAEAVYLPGVHSVRSTATPTASVAPTATATVVWWPSATPTDVWEPWPTATPTDAWWPTATSEPQPTATSQPALYSGSGDSVVSVAKAPGPMLARVSGNEAGLYFGVTAYDAANDYVSLLVNTADPYSGLCPLDFNTDKNTARLEVEATGPWQIELLPLSAARQLSVPGTLTGTGDEVIRLVGNAPDMATISGNAAGLYFGVISYDGGGDYCDLMVNVADPYSGTMIVRSCSEYLEIAAVGAWTVQVTAN